MRIAYMLTSLGRGGAERQVVALAERMAARGHEIAIVVLRQHEAHEWPVTVRIVRLDMTKSPVAAIRAFMRAWRFLRAFLPDIVHSHTFYANIIARGLHLAGAAPTVLSTIHNVYEGGWQRMLAYRLTDRLAIHTTAVSKAVAERYIRVAAVPQHKCSVITNGIDTAEFSPSGCAASRTQEFVQEQEDFIWLAAGRVVRAKDFDNLLAAFRIIHREIPRAQLWIAGKCAEAQLIYSRVTDGCEFNGIRWLGLRDDMPATIAAADAFVLSSAWEGMPLVVGEAMAMEKPVVATDVGGVRELIGDTGLIVPGKNPEALATAMLRVMCRPEHELVAMGLAARNRILQNFDMNAKTKEWEEFYAKLLAASRAAEDSSQGRRATAGSSTRSARSE